MLPFVGINGRHGNGDSEDNTGLFGSISGNNGISRNNSNGGRGGVIFEIDLFLRIPIVPLLAPCWEFLSHSPP